MQFNFRIITQIFGAILLLFTSAFSEMSYAAVHVSLSGSKSDSNAGYQKISSGSVSGGVSFDIADYVRLGYTHRQETSSASGHKYDETKKGTAEEYLAFTSDSHVTAHSVDLTLILYAGEVFTPFIFGGISLKNYEILNREQGKEDERINIMLPPGPSGGVGLSISMTTKFSLTLKHTMTEGYKQLPGQEAEKTIDAYSQVGISK
ncbi:MAG: hypothetical protein NT027_20350 [Proteobacteria bacterium]|nr:hypothetical protein [Pseudomonadota bacterium]